MNADGKPDLAGDTEYFLNSGAAPFFSSAQAKPLQVYGPDEEAKSLPADLPPASPPPGCMARDAPARFALSDLGVHRGFSDNAYQGTDDPGDALSPAAWVWRHTTYADANNDGITDRVVALSWPEEAAIALDLGTDTPLWQDARGRCGGINRVYLGNGRGQFFQGDLSIGGLYDWYGGPRARDFGLNAVQTAPAVTFEYTPPVNHQTLADFDGDGRAEMMQICGSGWANAIPDRNSDETGHGLREDSTTCPAGSVELPAMWNGQSASLPPWAGMRDDAVLGGYFDVDGNGLADVFVAANPKNPADPATAGGDLPQWRQSTLAVPQGRLTAIIGPYGGRTELHWSVVAEGGQGGAGLLPVIGSIEGMNGRTDFRFTAPTFIGGRLAGFQTAEAWGTSGIVQVTEFVTDNRRLGAIAHQAEYDQDGTLHSLVVHLDRAQAQRVALDPVAPFFNPVHRTCSFDFEADAGEDDPQGFIDECANFDGSEGPRGLLDSVTSDRQADTARRPLQSRQRAAPAGKLPPVGLADGGDILARTADGRVLQGQVDDIDDAAPLFATNNRLRVTEFAWDDLAGVLLEERALNDVTTTRDSTVTTFSYHPWNDALATRRLHTRKTVDVAADSARADPDAPIPVHLPQIRRFFEYPLADYAGTDWGREIQRTGGGLLPTVDRSRSRSRTFSDGAITRETEWGEVRAVSFLIDHCGQVSRRSTPLGWEEVERDPICREIRRETVHGRQELSSHDGLGRLRSQIIDSLLPGPDPARQSTLRLDYHPQAGLSRPVAVQIRSGASGPQTVTKTYVDEFGRSWKQVVCERRAGAPDTWTTSLDQAYPCADPARTATTVTLYDALSGLEGFTSLPFGPEGQATLGGTATHSGLVPAVALDSVPGTRTRHDRFGRLREQVLPDGRLVSHSYDLGRETTTGDGLTIDLLRRGTVTTLLRNGVLMNSARLNAFGEQVEETDALGNITTHGFDPWGRRVSTTLPEAEVWDTCQGPPIRKRATERATFSDTDEVLTITDALGNRVTKKYDAHGRLTEIRGPDGVVQEQRVYDDGFGALLPDDLLEPFGDRPGGVTIPGRMLQIAVRPRSVQTLDGMGNAYTVWIDALDRPFRQQAPDGTESLAEFDDRGRESRRTTPTGETVTMGYDWLDRPVRLDVDSGAGIATERREYDLRGNLVRTTDADGEVRQRSFDAMNRLLAETIGDPARRTPLTIARHEYDGNGRIAESTVNGLRTAFRYDDAGRLVRKLIGHDPAARPAALLTETLTYSPRDEVETTADRRGQGIRSIYDERGRVVARETLFDGAVLARTQAGYDQMGRLVRSVDEAGDVTCHEYDAYGRVVATTPPGLGTRRIDYTRDAPHPVTGQPTGSLRTRVTAPTGETIDSYVDAMARAWLTGNAASGYQQNSFADGRMVRSERIGLDGVTAAVKRYDYADRSTRIAREWDWMDPGSESACLADPAACATGSVSFAHTPGGRQLAQTDAAGNATLSHYADDGTMLLSRIDAAGVTQIRFEYDPAFPVVVAKERGPSASAIRSDFTLDRYLRPARTEITQAGSDRRERLDYAYDASGHRTGATLRRNGRVESRVEWTHDDFGRTRTRTVTAAGAPALSTGTSHRLEWDYTPTGRLGLVTYPSGNRVSYRYDGNGHLERIDLGFGPRSTPIATFGKPDPSGRYLSVDIAGGVSIGHSYRAGRERTRTVQAGTGGFAETYRYDPLGRLQATDRRAGGTDVQTIALDYDARDLLTGETATGGAGPRSYRYAFDTLGRRISKVTESSAGAARQLYDYAPGNRLSRVTGDAEAEITWDAYGRPVNDHRGLAFDWGLGDQLRAILLPDGQREEMLFDADGQRIARSTGDGTDLFYASDLPGEVYSQRRADGSYLDIVRDANGGVVALLDGDGAIIPWAVAKGDAATLAGDALSAFGEGAPASVDFGFHQMWSSALTPLRFAGVRVYDAETGRFLTPDPLGVTAASDPNDAIDPFRYAHNNPAALRDSTGYLGITPPDPTTIIVDGIAIETFNVEAWDNGTIRVANQAAYVAGVRAGIKAGLSRGWTLDESVQYAIGNGPPERAGSSLGIAGGLTFLDLGRPIDLFLPLFGKAQGSAQSFRTEDDQGTHAEAAEDAKRQAQGGGPSQGQIGFDENGVITGAVSGGDPTSSNFWLRVDGPNGPDVVGATSRETLKNFFAANPEYSPASDIFSGGDVETISVSPAPDTRSPFIRGVSAYWGIRTGVVKAAGGAVVESWNFLVHDNLGAWAAMAKCSWGYSCGFVPKSGFAASTDAYMAQGHSYPGAVFMTMSDGMFYGTLGAAEQIVLGSADGDWERVGENLFALGVTVGGAAVGGALEGMAAPTTRAGLLGGIVPDASDAGMMLMARARAPATAAERALVETSLDLPLIMRDASGTPRGVFFGQERYRHMAKVRNWMDDGVLADSLHIGGFHGNDDLAGFTMQINGQRYLISPQQLAGAVERAVPGTRFTYDHLLTCCGAAEGGAGGVFTRLRNRPVLSYNILVTINKYGRYISLEEGFPPFRIQRMIELDPLTGQGVRAHPFQGMSQTGSPVP
ncbi:RHS repeat-associated core domain-containing protein [Paracoccus sp. WLY502]|uniref:RHS repeat domain-containing protein n=1 Tax=Paracoccus yibinensis TaxID=3068891 RepID=UPI002796B060|nr:RHS repeat-associated core domain-containing protein [Paracoccus sp. WLY502]MDQ1901207.1 RHS repeat-associated core domain-containing protein [Paracoccus sp. WLY502]